jgi:hypothetical protein
MTMQRRALIIGHPGPGQPDRTGVSIDVREYTAFLMEAYGGYWHPSTIRVLNAPGKGQVVEEVERLKALDYSMVIFAGHGDQYRGDTYIGLEDGNFDSNLLRTGKKQTIILDCCRVERPPDIVEKSFAKSLLEAAEGLNGIRCRSVYNRLIQRCSKSAVLGFACSPDEEAAGNPLSGGYYSNRLLDAASTWAMSRSVDFVGTLSVVDAHEYAAAAVSRRTAGLQNPFMDSGRGGPPYFPFAVVA